MNGLADGPPLQAGAPTSAPLLFRPSAHAPPVARPAGYSHEEILRSQTLAGVVVAMCGLVIYGASGAWVLTVSIVSAVLAEVLIGVATRRRVTVELWSAVLSGLLLGLTLPASVAWYVPAIGSMAGILSKSLFGGMGHYVWPPALVGRVLVQVVFHQALSVGAASLPSTAAARGLMGSVWLDAPGPVSKSTSGGIESPESGASAATWSRESPRRALRRFAEGEIATEGRLVLVPLLRDHLPPWSASLLGLVQGGVGETCGLGIIVAGLYLIYRGYLRWQLPVSVVLAAALAAAVLPVESAAPGEGYLWLPVLTIESGRPVGLAYILYHLTSGELLLGAFLLAGDIIASPKRVRAQIVFGTLIGIMTIFMRLYGVLEGECYWSILIANSFVPVFDRWMKRPVLGLQSAE